MLQGIRPAFKFNVVIVSIYLIKRGENMFKKIITAVLATLMLLIVLPTRVFAEERESNQNSDSSEKYIFKQFDDIKDITLNNTLSSEEYEKFMGNDKDTTMYYTSYSTSSATEENTEGYTRYLLVSGGSYTIENWAGVRTWKGYFGCEPRFAIQLYYAYSGAKPKITAIKHADMYTGIGSPCIFDGTIYVELISGKSFYYSYSGNLFERGQMNVSGSLNIGIGKAASATITVSNGDGFISNVYNSETFKNDLFAE